jgi:exopolysaccharide biosynthesis polyprenyl glycosylphosphotransferase
VSSHRAAALRPSLAGEVASLVDERTLEILERRRRTAIVKRRGWLVRRMLLVADVLGLAFAFLLSELFTQRPVGADVLDSRTEFVVFLLTVPGWIVLAKLYGLYDHDEERADHSTADDVLGVFHMLTVGAWVFYAFVWAAGVIRPDFPKLVWFWLLAILLVSGARAVARAYCRRQIQYLQNTVIVGAGNVGQLVARKLLRHPEYGINLVGFVDAAPRDRAPGLEHLSMLGNPEQLPALVRLFDIERVVMAFSQEPLQQELDMIRALKDLDVQIDIVPRLFELLSPSVGVHTVEGLPLLGLAPMKLSHSSRLLKRGVDLLVASVALFLFAPLLAVLAYLVKRSSPGPVFFRQVRMGEGSLTFRIFKFRTMDADADARKSEVAHLNVHLAEGGDPRMFKIADDPRVTRVGRFLRKTSLDELPQLLNVLRGEMSLVGPRPLILDEDQYVCDWGRQRLDLKPGLTGPWQVLGRNEIPFEEMVKLDYLYVTGWSLFNDLKLILRTVPVVFGRRGA